MYEEHLPDFLRNLDPSIYLSDNYLVLDLETQVVDGTPSAAYPAHGDIVCAGWKRKYQPVKVKYAGMYELFDLVQACYDADFIVGHNIKFDLEWLYLAGLDLRRVLVYDTMIGEYVLTGNQLAGKRGALTLDTLCKAEFGEGKDRFIDILMKGGVCPSQQPKSLLMERNGCDVIQTEQLFLRQRERINKAGKLPLLYTRCLLSPVLADIELRGVHLDGQRVEKEHAASTQARYEVMRKLDVILEGRNPNSVPQMRDLLYNVLKFTPPKKNKEPIYPTGAEDILALLKPTNKKQRDFLALKSEYARHQADLSKNLDYFFGTVKEKGSIFYAEFNQAVTKTHRLSSSGMSTAFAMFKKNKSIQLQNSPRKYKKLYCARKGDWYIIELDGAQIEFRVAGYLGQDVRICQDIVDGTDIHSFTASVMNDCTPEEVSGEQRTDAKSETFKPLYGGQFGSEKQMAYYAAFREKYAGITKAQQKWEGECLRRKKMRMETGLEFHFPACKLSSSGYNKDFPSICNYPVQSLATAEIVPIAITALWHLMGAMKLESFLVNTVHDSVISESPKHELQTMYELGKWAFLWWVYEYLEAVYGIVFNVPLGVGFKAGLHWGEGVVDAVSPTKVDGEVVKVKGSEVVVTGIPPVRMDGVDYSKLEG